MVSVVVEEDWRGSPLTYTSSPPRPFTTSRSIFILEGRRGEDGDKGGGEVERGVEKGMEGRFFFKAERNVDR